MLFSTTVIVSMWLLSTTAIDSTHAFVVPIKRATATQVVTANRCRYRFILSNTPHDTDTDSDTATPPSQEQPNTHYDDSYLPPELAKITMAFSQVNDDSIRHKQLLYMANQLAPLSDHLRIPENKVPGCLSTVFVDATAQWDDATKEHVIQYVGDSDGLLTKGLVALLVRGLSGSSVDEIEAVSPNFIQVAQIGQSLTPGRNNGFLNMLKVMKQKARMARDKATLSNQNDDDSNDNENDDTAVAAMDRPIYHGILSALQKLNPSQLTVVDNSHLHAGHAGSQGYTNGESHFEVAIVASAFEGLNLVKRHKLVYMLLGDVMPHIHALQISAKTPEEVGTGSDD